jgi:hypothetical protein
MKFAALIAAALVLPGVAMAEEQQVPGTVSAPASTTPMATQATVNVPVIRWNQFKGRVTHVNQANGMLEVKVGDTDTRVGIPVTPQTVGIYKKDHRHDLKDIKAGDDVTVRNLAATF